MMYSNLGLSFRETLPLKQGPDKNLTTVIMSYKYIYCCFPSVIINGECLGPGLFTIMFCGCDAYLEVNNTSNANQTS